MFQYKFHIHGSAIDKNSKIVLMNVEWITKAFWDMRNNRELVFSVSLSHSLLRFVAFPSPVPIASIHLLALPLSSMLLTSSLLPSPKPILMKYSRSINSMVIPIVLRGKITKDKYKFINATSIIEHPSRKAISLLNYRYYAWYRRCYMAYESIYIHREKKNFAFLSFSSQFQRNAKNCEETRCICMYNTSNILSFPCTKGIYVNDDNIRGTETKCDRESNGFLL